MHYDTIQPLIPDILKVYNELGTGIVLPNRKTIKILRFFLGWRNALKITKKIKL